MGLPTLREKIGRKFSAPQFSEEDALYLLVEVAKYLERSLDSKDLHDPPHLKVNPKDFPSVLFFRNWAAHTEKDRGEIPNKIANVLVAVADGAEVADRELFDPLIAEFAAFAKAIEVRSDDRWDEFVYRLKCILAEQPVKLRELNVRVGFNDGLALSVL